VRLADERRAVTERLSKPGRTSDVAKDAWNGLDQLAECTEIVRAARQESNNTAENVLAKVSAFKALRDILQGTLTSSTNLVVSVTTLSDACGRAEDEIKASQDATLAAQQKLRKSAQERAKNDVENLIKNRDLQRNHLSQVLVSALCDLLAAASKVVPPSFAYHKLVADAVKNKRRFDLVSIAKPSSSEWKQAAESDAKQLQDSLLAATKCVEEYAIDRKKAIGSSEPEWPEDATEDSAAMVRAALRAYSDWKERVGADTAARRTDEALEKMQASMLTSLRKMFSGSTEQERGEHKEAIKSAMFSCGVTVQAEHEALAKDFLSDMPCHLIISTGRQLLEQRQALALALSRVHAVVCEITRELDMITSLVDSKGVLVLWGYLSFSCMKHPYSSTF
jgi:hypothetical protein